MLGGLGSDLNLEGFDWIIGGFGLSFSDWASQVERAGSWFWSLGMDSPVLGRGSREGSCIG